MLKFSFGRNSKGVLYLTFSNKLSFLISYSYITPQIPLLHSLLKYDKDEFDYGLEYEIEKTTRSFKVGSRQQEHNLIDALKIACRKFSKEKTGKKPFTNINLVRI